MLGKPDESADSCDKQMKENEKSLSLRGAKQTGRIAGQIRERPSNRNLRRARKQEGVPERLKQSEAAVVAKNLFDKSAGRDEIVSNVRDIETLVIQPERRDQIRKNTAVDDKN